MNKPSGWDWRPWLFAAGLALSLAVAVVFAWRGLQNVPRRQVDEPVRPWMTVPYVARSYRVPSAVLFAALGLPAKPADRRPIMAIARAQGRPVPDVIAALEQAIAQTRQAGGTPTPTPAAATAQAVP